MRKKYFILPPYEYMGVEKLSDNGINQSLEALARISENAQPLANEKSMIIKIHHPPNTWARKTAEHLVGDLINAGYKRAMISEIYEKPTAEVVKEKILEAEMYDGAKQIPVLCGFVSVDKKGDITFDEVKV